MTPLHHSLIQILLPVCIETTARQREKPPPPELDKELWEGVKSWVKHYKYGQIDWPTAFIDLIATATKRPEIKQYASAITTNQSTSLGPHYDPLTVVVLEANGSNHQYKLKHPYIVVNGKNFRLLEINGKTNSTRFESIDQPRLATDEEIELCLESLTANQIRTIMAHELFAPIVNKLFEAETELVVEKEVKIITLYKGYNYIKCETQEEAKDIIEKFKEFGIRYNYLFDQPHNYRSFYWDGNSIESLGYEILQIKQGIDYSYEDAMSATHIITSNNKGPQE